MQNKTRVFVYGTLKRGHANFEQMIQPPGRSEFLCSARTKSKYRLIVGPPYGAPFLAHLSQQGSEHVEGNRILGEVFEVDDEMLHKLDKFEGCPTYYKREPLEVVKVEEGEEKEAIEGCSAYFRVVWEEEYGSLPLLSEYLFDPHYLPPSKRPPGWINRYIQQTEKINKNN